MLVSGTGHFLHRQWGAGIFYLLVFGVVPAFHYFLHLSWPGLRSLAERNGLAEIDLLVGLLLVDLLLLAVLLGGVYSAWAVGRELSGAGADPAPNPLGPALCSLLVPGWGQIVNGQVLEAMAFLAVVYAGSRSKTTRQTPTLIR